MNSRHSRKNDGDEAVGSLTPVAESKNVVTELQTKFAAVLSEPVPVRLRELVEKIRQIDSYKR